MIALKEPAQSAGAERPPFAQFERRAVDRKVEGELRVVEEDFVFITPLGSKDRLEWPVGQWLEYVRKEVKRARMPREWEAHFDACYEAFQKGQEPPENGLSVRNWPAITRAEAERLWRVNCRTVEDLAAANEGLLAQLGMGARSLKQRAEDWLKANSGQAKRLVGDLDALRKQNAALLTRIESLERQAREAAGGAPLAPPAPGGVDSQLDQILGN